MRTINERVDGINWRYVLLSLAYFGLLWIVLSLTVWPLGAVVALYCLLFTHHWIARLNGYKIGRDDERFANLGTKGVDHWWLKWIGEGR